MPKDYVIYQGVKMAAEWPAKIIEAQAIQSYMIEGQRYERIRYGAEAENWGADKGPCHDCGVIKGQYHVPSICDVERCPPCEEQVISCDCRYEDDS
jgi:hypothetical protein